MYPNSFDSAYKRLATGRGNLIARAERIKHLGIKVKKALPSRTYIEKIVITTGICVERFPNLLRVC